MIKYKKIKNTLKSAPKMFFDSSFYEKSKQSKIENKLKEAILKGIERAII